jgi:hypothetical protein
MKASAPSPWARRCVITEYRFALELEVTPSARAYIGFRHMEYEVENLQPEYELDDDGHVGIRIEF